MAPAAAAACRARGEVAATLNAMRSEAAGCDLRGGAASGGGVAMVTRQDSVIVQM